MKRVASVIGVLAAGCIPICAVAAPTLTTLYTFTGADGAQPGAGLLPGPHGSFFGTTEGGGAGGLGTVFQLFPPKNGSSTYTLTTLHGFSGTDGAYPTNMIADHNGNLFGVTSAGGQAGCASGGGCGTVFELKHPAPGQTQWTQVVLHDFNGVEEGVYPTGLRFDERGNLYGFTWGGSGTCANGCGTIYQLTPPTEGQTAWGYNRLYTFTDDQDGDGPFGTPLIDHAGSLYGIAYSGGPTAPGSCLPFSGCGEVFKLSQHDGTWTKSTLWTFDGTNGTGAWNSLTTDGRGHLFGMTNEGGTGTANCPVVPTWNPAGCGTAFELSPPSTRDGSWTQNVLWNFSGDTDGAFPANGKLTWVEDGLVGMTSGGGNDPVGIYGSVVKFIAPTHGQTSWTEQTLYTFTNDANGAVPVGDLLSRDGALYGTTYGWSGVAAGGTVYSITQ
jgi:uncharacterized protein YceK